MDAELLVWNIDDNNILLGSIPSTSFSINFESVSSYNDQIYHSLRGIDKINPLLIQKFINIKGDTDFLLLNLKFSGYPVEQIKPYLMNLASKGFYFITRSLILLQFKKSSKIMLMRGLKKETMM